MREVGALHLAKLDLVSKLKLSFAFSKELLNTETGVLPFDYNLHIRLSNWQSLL